MKNLLIFMFFTMGFCVYSSDYILRVTPIVDTMVYVNGFPFYFTGETSTAVCSSAIKSGKNEIVIRSKKKSLVSIKIWENKHTLNNIFEHKLSQNEIEVRTRFIFDVDDKNFKLVWEKVKCGNDYFSNKDSLIIRNLAMKYVDAFKSGNFAPVYGVLKYEFANYGLVNGVKKPNRSFDFMYKEFLAPRKRLEWNCPEGKLLVKQSNFNKALIIVSKSGGQPIFRIKSSIGRFYVKYFIVLVKVSDKWYFQ